MCWSASASVAFVAAGSAATALSILRRDPPAIWLTISYFTLMEGLQAVGYAVVDQCGTPANKTIAGLSYLHVALQPIIINMFAMAIAPAPISPRMRRAVLALAAACSAVMLVQMLPWEALGPCRPGSLLCGLEWCLVSGNWHIGWQVPLNGLFTRASEVFNLRLSFPSYTLAALILPLFYGAWRFALFNAVFGATLSHMLTDDPLEMPAIWCLFSVGIVLISLSPPIRQRITGGEPHRV